MTRNNKKRRPAVEASPRQAMIMSLWGLLAAVVTAAVLIPIAATVAIFCPDPRAVARIAGYAILYISAFIGGAYTYRRCRGYALLCGLNTGLCYTALTLIMSLALGFMSSSISPGLAFALRLPIVAAAIGGAVAGSYTPKRRPRRRR